MVWFKKKEVKKLPDFSELPQLPELPYLPEMQSLPELPSFPQTEIGEKFRQEAVKRAVTEPYEIVRPETPATRTIEISGIEARRFPQQEISEIQQMAKIQKPLTKSTEPIFVRIDKYEASLETFEEIKRKVTEIESLLKDIKEIKNKEDIELNDWEKEIETVKVWLDNIDKTLFSKLE